MLNAVKGFSSSPKNGLFVNSCFAHCQSERQDTWFADDSPAINKKVCKMSLLGYVCEYGIHFHRWVSSSFELVPLKSMDLLAPKHNLANLFGSG